MVNAKDVRQHPIVNYGILKVTPNLGVSQPPLKDKAFQPF
jgi:hypothetical protein